MAERLTNELVGSKPAPAKGAITVWDDDPKAPGFGVRIFAATKQHPAGVRSFFLNYRVDGVERRYTIGRFPKWSTTAARAEAQELGKRVDKGEDPAVAKRDQREAPTVQDLIDRYIADHLPQKAANKEPARRADELRMLDLIGDSLGRRRKVAEIHSGDIEAVHRQITAANGPVRANRVKSIASKMFSLSLKVRAGEKKAWRDKAAGNPCQGVESNHEDQKERFLSEAEISAVSDALNEHAAGSSADCIRFMMFTGCRPKEAMRATWAQIDQEPGFWVKPSAHTKQKKIHKAPFTAPALALVDKLRKARKDDNPYLFPGQLRKGRAKAHVTQVWHVWQRVKERATVALWEGSADAAVASVLADLRQGLGRRPAIKEVLAEAQRRAVALPIGLLDVRPYDARHTFASVGAGGGESLLIIGKLLGHTQARTTQRYAHLADNPLREAANRIGAVISGAAQPARAEVIPLKR